MNSFFRVLFFIVVFSIVSLSAYAETEPNNTPAQANALAANSSDAGTLNINGDVVDWYKVTLPSDGALIIATLSSAGLEIDNAIFDQNGTTLLASYLHGGTHVEDTTEVFNLLAGTYYVRTLCYSGSGSYTITSKFIATQFPNDAELNDSLKFANAFTLNSSATGHLGFYGNGNTDGVDWRKVVTNADGKFVIATYSDPTIEIDNAIYDQDKKTLLASYKYGGSHLEDTSEVVNLAAGTYYIRTLCYSGYGSYTITNLLTPTALTNDAEQNDSASVAIAFPLNSNSTGHLGFFNNGYTDAVDWRKVVTNADGKFVIATYSDPTLEIDNAIYDQDKKTLLASYKYGGTHREDTSEVVNLAAGTYYIRTFCYSGYGSYTITNRLTQAMLANDTEPNNTQAQAIPLGLNAVKSGHLGYLSQGITDLHDFYAVTLAQAADTLFIRTDSNPQLEIDFSLLNAAGSVVASGSVYGVTEFIAFVKPAAGTYFVDVKAYSGYGSYNIIATTNTRPGSQPVSVQMRADDRIPAEFSLSQNYPNPFNPATRIRYAVAAAQHVRVTVHDVLGREVASLVDEVKAPGRYEAVWNAGALPSGIYYVRMCSGSFAAVKKVMFIK